VSSESSCALRLARHSQMHGLDTSNVSSRVESSQVEFEPNITQHIRLQNASWALLTKKYGRCLLIYVFIQHTNNITGIGQTTGFVDELSIMWSTHKDVVRYLVTKLLQMFSRFWQWNKFENRSIFDEFTAYKTKCASFLVHPVLRTH